MLKLRKRENSHLDEYLTDEADSPDNVYYNVNMVNNTGVSRPAIDTITLSKSILENAKDYYMSVIRFVMDGSNIPIMTVPNPSNFWITVVWTGGASSPYQKQLQVLPWMTDRTLDSFTAFAQMVNAAFTSILADMIVDGFGGTKPLNMRWSTANYTFPIVIPEPIYAAAPKVRLFFNTNLYNLFGNYYADVIQESGANRQDVEIFLDDLGEANVGISLPVGAWVINQEFPSTSRFFDVTSIIFLSNTLNQNSEYYPVENTTTNLSTSSSSGAGNATLPILTDFQPVYAFGNPAGPRQYIYYSPTSQYKLTDMLSNKINQLDIRLMTRDRQGKQAQIYIPPHQSFQIKIGFFKKTVYNKT